ncbi:MAG: hypothetical protein K9L79_01555 [Methylobacter tundripaludum]|nr:hypothetical protein [Methylobacter tundripaludum]
MSLENRLTLLAQALGVDVKALTTAIGVLSSLNTTAKTSLVAAVNEVLAAGNANAGKIGDTATLTTTAKTNVVAAINEINAALGNLDLTGLIDDLAVSSVTDKTYSANKITNLIAAAVTALVDASPATMDTLNELAAALANDPNFATTITTALGNRVRVDAAQTFTAPEQTQARDNIGAASTAEVASAQTAADTANTDLAALILALGDIDHDFVADYTAAKA